MRPRSTSSGGAIPRESERSSSTVSRAWSSAASMVSHGAVGVVGQLPTGATEVHRQPDQPLLRPVVDVALEPAQRDRLGLPRGVPAALDAAYVLLELGPAAQQHRAPGRRAASAANRITSGRVTRANDPDHQVEPDLGVPAVAEAESAASVVASSESIGQPPLPEPVGQPAGGRRPPRQRQRRTRSVPVTIPARHHTTSSHDCGSRSGVSSAAPEAVPGSGQRYAGVAACCPACRAAGSARTGRTRAPPSPRPRRAPAAQQDGEPQPESEEDD